MHEEPIMQVDLRDLKPNPLRDFTVDPLDEEIVKKLKQSITQDGFWGGVVARKVKGGDIQVAAGWHRVKAALKAGIDRADIFVSRDMDDAKLVRIYANENALQRGNTGTAITGTIAAAIHYLAKGILTGGLSEIGQSSLEIARGRIATEDGIGRDLILKFLSDVPGIGQHVIVQQLGILKASGDYTRIIDQVKEEIERESKDAAAIELALAAAKAADALKITFDYQGVSKYLKVASHIETFREAVTSPGITPYLKVSGQADLAAKIVALATDAKVELTSAFIRQWIDTMVHGPKVQSKRLTREEEEERLRENWDAKWRDLQTKFAKNVNTMLKKAMVMTKHAEERPKGVRLHTTSEFRDSINTAREVIKLINSKVL
jgi:hypothetical protein